MAVPVPRLLLSTQADSAAPATFCCNGYTANSTQAHHFKPSLRLKHRDRHADAGEESHPSTIYWLPPRKLMTKYCKTGNLKPLGQESRRENHSYIFSVPLHKKGHY